MSFIWKEEQQDTPLVDPVLQRIVATSPSDHPLFPASNDPSSSSLSAAADPIDIVATCQQALRMPRAYEDNLIHHLNTVDTRQASICRQFRDGLEHLWRLRRNILEQCLEKVEKDLTFCQAQQQAPALDQTKLEEWASRQRLLTKEKNWLRSQQTIHAIIQDRSLKIWKDKCRVALQADPLLTSSVNLG